MAAKPQLERRLQELLTDEVYQSVWRYCYRLAGSQHDAEDLLQESLLVAFVKLPQLRNQDAFKGWMFSIVRSKFLKGKRRLGKAADVNVSALDNLPQENSELGVEIQAAIGRLPEAQREILSLFYLSGLSLEETGQALGIPGRAVKQRLFRARAALRRHLEPQLLAGDLSALF